MTKIKFIVSLILLCFICFSFPVTIGPKLFAFGLIVLIIWRFVFIAKLNKIKLENEKLLNEKLKKDSDF